MRYAKSSWLIIMLALSLVLSACNLGQEPEPTLDVGAIFTAAAETVSAQFALDLTQTALAAPTATPIPTNTPTPVATFAVETSAVGVVPTTLGTQSSLATPLATITPLGALAPQAGPLCDDSILVDESVPDGTVFKPGEDFVKTFTIQNTGTCTWDEGYSFVYQGGTLDGYTIDIKKKEDFVGPGESILFKIDLTASLAPNTYTNCWKMRNDRDYYFGTYACVTIEVKK